MFNYQKIKSYKINILETDDILAKEISSAYWDIKDEKFQNKPTDLAKKYNLKPNEIRQIINKFSTVTRTLKDCIDCGVEQTDTVESQTAFISDKGINDRCEECNALYNLEKEKQATIQRQIKAEIKQKNFDNAIAKQVWKTLNDTEYVVLNLILTHQTLNKILSNSSQLNIPNKNIWQIFDKLERVNLIYIERNYYNGITNLEFDPKLISEINNNKNSIKQNTLGFSLERKINRVNERQPHYGGTFTLKEDVILKAGKVYLYGGWIQNDQSINLKFTPINQINKAPNQTKFDHEPKHISDIINNIFNELS